MQVTTEIELKSKLNKNELTKMLESRGVKIDKEMLSDGYLSNALENHMYLTYLPEFIASPIDKTARFYARYYWLSNLVERYKKRFGQDAGMEQQVFKLLEEAESEDLKVDWNLIEQIQNRAVKNAATNN